MGDGVIVRCGSIVGCSGLVKYGGCFGESLGLKMYKPIESHPLHTPSNQVDRFHHRPATHGSTWACLNVKKSN